MTLAALALAASLFAAAAQELPPWVPRKGDSVEQIGARLALAYEAQAEWNRLRAERAAPPAAIFSSGFEHISLCRVCVDWHPEQTCELETHCRACHRWTPWRLCPDTGWSSTPVEPYFDLDLLFADGFETGELNDWSEVKP